MQTRRGGIALMPGFCLARDELDARHGD